MNRSKKVVFVPHCALFQGIRATGIVKKYPAIVTPVINYLVTNNFNIVQMPCPELVFDTLHRSPCKKNKYDKPGNRRVCKNISEEIVERMIELKTGGFELSLVIGVDFSPSCAVKQLTGREPRSYVSGKGIFTEELQKIMNSNDLGRIPFVGIQIYQIEKTMADIKKILKK